MIGGVVQHGRRKSDSKNLASHLLKDRGVTVEMLNSAAPDLPSVLADMELARDGSRANSAYLHMYLSPSRDMSHDELRRAANIALEHFGASDHQAALVFHDKPRVGGEGERHLHIVVGRVSPDGHVLPSGFDKIKMETAMRLAEFELGETPTLGRHTASGIKWMKANGRSDVAQWLEKSHGPNPDKPRSIITAEARQGLERKGVVIGSVRETVIMAWERSDNSKSFMAAMSENGLSVELGQKPGVFVVRQGETEIGALDRIIKQKRGDVAAKMKGYLDDTVSEKSSNASYERPRRSSLSKGRVTAAIVGSSEYAGAKRGGANRDDTTVIGSSSLGTETNVSIDRRSGEKSRKIDENKALIILDKVRLSSSTIISVQEIKTHHRLFNLFELNSAARKLETHRVGWQWVQEFKADLLEKIRELKDRVFRTEEIHEPKNVTYISVTSDDDDYQPMSRFR